MGMIEGGEHDSFPLEAREAVGLARELRGQDLERDLALELGIARAPDLAHASRAQRTENFVVRQLHPRSNTHRTPDVRNLAVRIVGVIAQWRNQIGIALLILALVALSFVRAERREQLLRI